MRASLPLLLSFLLLAACSTSGLLAPSGPPPKLYTLSIPDGTMSKGERVDWQLLIEEKDRALKVLQKLADNDQNLYIRSQARNVLSQMSEIDCGSWHFVSAEPYWKVKSEKIPENSCSDDVASASGRGAGSAP